MRALVTGAFGFVGRHLCQQLVDQGTWDVVGLSSRIGRPIHGVHPLACNLLDADLTKRVIRRHRPEVIFHLAAQAYVPQSVANPVETLLNNAGAQINVLEACRSAEIDPIIVIASSAEVYGAVPPDRLPITEDEPFRPANPYAVSKITQDMLGLQYHLSYQLRTVRVRPFNHVGPGQSDRFVVSSFARQIAEVEIGRADPVLLVGNLDAQRDFLDVRDVARAYMEVAREQFAGEVFNIASGQARSVRSILEFLLSRSRLEIAVRQDPSRLRPSDVPVLIGDARRLRKATGWAPKISLDDSLAETLDYWRQRLQAPHEFEDAG